MDRPLDRRRLLLWGGLGVLLVGSVAFLVVGLVRRGAAPPPPASPSVDTHRPIVVRVVDASGAPARGARAFVAAAPGALPEAAGRWDPETATLTLPWTGRPHAVAVQARGHRLLEVADVRGDRTLSLEPGIVARFFVEPETPRPEPPRGVYLQVNPVPPPDREVSPEERDSVVDLMDLLVPRAEGGPDFPRAGFGFLVSEAEGRAGLLLPMPGRYRVRWGLLDAKAGSWYALRDGAESSFDVVAATEPQTFSLSIDPQALARAGAELDAEIARRAAAAADAPPEGEAPR